MKNSLFSDDNYGDKKDRLFPSGSDDQAINFLKNNPDKNLDIQIKKKFFRVLIVDDEEDIHTVTEIALKNYEFKGQRLEILHAFSAQEAKEILTEYSDIALVLLDVVMEKNNAGLELVKYIRNELSNSFIRIILRTGQPGHAPEREVIDLYEIDDYKLKTELTAEKLCSVTTTSLRNFEVIMSIEKERDEFDRQVKERTKSLEQKKDRLVQAKNMAKEVDKGKEYFLSNISHEIRTPLFGVLGMTELLMKTNIDESQQEYIEIIHSSGENILTIVNDITDLSIIENNDIQIKNEPVILSHCFEKIVKLLNPSTINKNLTLSYNISNDVPYVIECDDVRISQIIINLIANAIKFSEHGTIMLSAYKCIDPLLMTSDKDFFHLEFSVKDQGIGIAEDKIDSLFKPFSQTDVSTFKKYGGTGLGLSICKRLCELMNGKIWVESTLKKGSTFYFTIKTRAGKQFVNFNNTDIAYKGYNANNINKNKDANKLHILVVDDNLINQKTTHYYLKIMGFDADIATDGITAVLAASKKEYDIIFMDIKMPRMDGIEATRQIRAKYSKPNHPVIIALTANTQKKYQEKCYKVGMNDYIIKPVGLNMLTDIILKWKEKICADIR